MLLYISTTTRMLYLQIVFCELLLFFNFTQMRQANEHRKFQKPSIVKYLHLIL